MSIEWNAETKQFHLRNDRISNLIRVLENGSPGQCFFGRALAAGRSYRHLGPGDER